MSLSTEASPEGVPLRLESRERIVHVVEYSHYPASSCKSLSATSTARPKSTGSPESSGAKKSTEDGHAQASPFSGKTASAA